MRVLDLDMDFFLTALVRRQRRANARPRTALSPAAMKR